MSKLKVLSGKEVITILELFGFHEESRRGSHVKLRRMGPNSERQTLTIPDHSELDSGTLRAIYRQILRYVDEQRLREHFYSD